MKNGEGKKRSPLDLSSLRAIYLFRSGERASIERRSTVNSYHACCFDGSLHSRHRCNYVTRAELINCSNVGLIQPTNVETCCNSLGSQLITFAWQYRRFPAFLPFFLPFFCISSSRRSAITELHSATNAMRFLY